MKHTRGHVLVSMFLNDNLDVEHYILLSLFVLYFHFLPQNPSILPSSVCDTITRFTFDDHQQKLADMYHDVYNCAMFGALQLVSFLREQNNTTQHQSVAPGPLFPISLHIIIFSTRYELRLRYHLAASNRIISHHQK